MGKTVIDLKGLRYSMPLVKLSTALRKASPGDIFEAVSDYAEFDREITIWCDGTGNELRDVTREDGLVIATVVKAGA
jgi:TusA-related sulfurtransferase